MKNKKVIKIIIFVIIIVIIAVVGTLYENNNNFRTYLDKYVFLKEKHENNLPKILIEYDNSTYVYSYKNDIIVLKNNILTAYNKYGSEEYNIDIDISNPIFCSNGNYLAIAEKNGTKLYVLCDKNIIWQKNLEGQILDLKINSEGYLLVATNGTIYKQVLQTFDKKGNELFKNFISSTYIVDMDISPDSKHIAIAEANCSGILVQSNIKEISVDKAKNDPSESIIYTKTGEDGDLIVNLKYQNSSRIVALYDNHIESINKENVETIDFKDDDVLFLDLNNRIIKIINRDSQIFLQIISDDLKNIKEYEIQEPKSICVSDNFIALNLGNEILFYSNSGWLTKRYYADQEVNKIVLCDDVAGIIYNEKIELISL